MLDRRRRTLRRRSSASRAVEPRLVALVEPMLGVSLAPTRVFASEKINVIPSQARLAVDCRVPPGLGAEAAPRRRSTRSLGDRRATASSGPRQVMGNRSPIDSPMADLIRAWIAEQDPEALCAADRAAPASPTRAPSAPPSPSARPTASSRTGCARASRPTR